MGVTPWTKDPLPLKNAILLEVHRWFNWTGRNVAAFIGQTLLTSNYLFHWIISPLVFCLIIFLSQVLIWGKNWRIFMRFWHPVLIFILIWLFSPTFGESYLWRMGAANYLYPAFFILLFLVPYRYLLDDPTYKPGILFILIFPIISLCAGWSNENTGAFTVIISFSLSIYVYRKTGNLHIWAIAGALLSLIGCIMLLAAPGNIQRANIESNYYLSLGIWEKVIFFWNYFEIKAQKTLLIPSIIFLFGLYFLRKKRITCSAWVALSLFLMGQISLLVLFLSPTHTQRAGTFASLLVCFSSFYFLARQGLFSKWVRCIIIVFIFSRGGWSLIHDGFFTFYEMHKITLVREERIRNSKTPVVPPYPKTGKFYFPQEGLWDFDTNDISKPIILKFYDLDDITVAKE